MTATVAALTVIPEAATGHDFWTEKDSEAKHAQRALFARDLGLLGGLLVTAVETGGRESVPHRAVRTRQAAKASRKAASDRPRAGRLPKHGALRYDAARLRPSTSTLSRCNVASIALRLRSGIPIRS